MQSKHILPLLAVALVLWGAYHALGAYLYNHNLARFVVVFGCMLAFLAFWGLMLLARRKRLKRQSSRRLGPKNAC